MLTKEERAAIAERMQTCAYIYNDALYKVLFGCNPAADTSLAEDSEAIFNRIIDLCDTSNMIELPLDKGGKVIHISDVVYDNSDMELEITNIRIPLIGACIGGCSDGDYYMFRPDELTHKNHAAIKPLVEELRSTLYAAHISGRECEKILHIADQLESLGGSDD